MILRFCYPASPREWPDGTANSRVYTTAQFVTSSTARETACPPARSNI